MKKIAISFTCALCMMLSSIGIAKAANTEADALAMVKKSVSVVLSDLKKNKGKYTTDYKALNHMIDTKMIPYFDTDVMSKYVLGKNWKNTTEAQRTAFYNEFKQLIMRTYSNGLLDFSDAKVSYGTPDKVHKNRTKVKVEIVNNAGKKFPLELSLRYKNGQWKGYDVSMDGLSVITSYRSSIGEEVAQKGIQAVIEEIKTLNAKGAVKK